jgi:hypothetical protein
MAARARARRARWAWVRGTAARVRGTAARVSAAVRARARRGGVSRVAVGRGATATARRHEQWRRRVSE